MSNENKFYELCKIMANLKDVIDTFQDIGFIVEPDNRNSKSISTNLYASCDIVYNIAASLLNFPDVNTENGICNELMKMGSETVEDVSKKVWDEYGVK